MSAVDDQLVVERAIGGEAGQGGGRGDLRGEAHRAAVLDPLADRRHRGVDLVQVGGIVHLEPRLHRQDLRVAHRGRILAGGVGREHELAPPVQDHPEPAERGGHVFPAQRILRMIEIAHEPVAHAAQDGRAAHHPAAHQGAAHPGIGPNLTGAARHQPDRRLGLVGRHPRHDVHRAADDVAPVEGALRPAQHFDPLDVDEVGQHPGRPRQVDAVEIHGGARVGAGKDDIGADAADGELREAGVLREGDRRTEPGQLLHRVHVGALQLVAGQHAHGHRHGVHVALADLRGGDHGVFLQRHLQDHRHRGGLIGLQPKALACRREPSGDGGQVVVAGGQFLDREPSVGPGPGGTLDRPADGDRRIGQRTAGGVGDDT